MAQPGMLRAIIDTIPDQIYIKDTESRFILCNQAVTVNAGTNDTAELIGKTDFDFFPPEDAKVYFEDEQTLMKQGIPLINHEEKIVNKNTGEVSWNLTTKIPYFDDNGKLLGLIGINRDISQRKKVEKALEESEILLRELNATKDKLFSIIAHDLKNPFSSIIGFSEMLMEAAGDLDPNRVKEYSEAIYSAANQTLQLLENLLQWARMQQNSVVFERTDNRFRDLSVDALAMVAVSAVRKDIRLLNEIPPELVVRVDKNMMNALMRNLLCNAIKFTHPGGMVKLSAVVLDGEIRVSVSDTGIGMSAEKIKALFLVGSNVSTRGTGNEKGTGLGLILCKDFVTKHGGRIWVESEEGKGSTFFFTIPLISSTT